MEYNVLLLDEDVMVVILYGNEFNFMAVEFRLFSVLFVEFKRVFIWD